MNICLRDSVRFGKLCVFTETRKTYLRISNLAVATQEMLQHGLGTLLLLTVCGTYHERG